MVCRRACNSSRGEHTSFSQGFVLHMATLIRRYCTVAAIFSAVTFLVTLVSFCILHGHDHETVPPKVRAVVDVFRPEETTDFVVGMPQDAPELWRKRPIL